MSTGALATPLSPAVRNHRIAVRLAVESVSALHRIPQKVTADGISDVKNEMLGYSIIEASSHEAAAKLLKDHPTFQIPGASIDVVEISSMANM
jgi:hypothetical protein